MSSSSSSSSSRILMKNARALGDRLVRLPRNILGGFSRTINQGISDLIGRPSRTNYQNHPPVNNFPYQQHPPLMVQEEWAFLTCFEQQYGTMHPFFYACRFADALKMAQNEHKLLFMYIHSPEHPFTADFCRGTLCSEVVVQFLDANFVCWGGVADRGEGLQMAATLRASSFPFCAVVAPAHGDNLVVLQQLEGPVTPAELVEALQRTMEEQGLAFGSGRAKQEEKSRIDRRLREEQDAAYLAALKIDQEKERLQKKPTSQEKDAKPEKPKANSLSKLANKVKPATTNATTSQKADKKAEITQILIRFPNGERRENSFSSTDKIQAIYRYIDSLGLVGAGNYRLISNFPRKVYGVDQMRMTLKDAGLHPKASLFLEIL